MHINTTTYSFPLEYPGINLGTMHHFFRAVEVETILQSMPPREFIGLCFNLGEDINYQVTGGHELSLAKGHYNMMYMSEACCTFRLPKGDYSCFCIEFTDPYLSLVATAFPVLKAFMIRAGVGIPGLMNKNNLAITPDIREKIDNVLTTQYKGELREDFLKTKFIDLLFTCMEHSQRNFYAGLSKTDIEKIQRAHDLIVKDVSTSWSVSLLADEVDIDKRKLVNGFKIIFEDTIYHFLTEERMKKAIAMLRNTALTATQISADVGYKRFTTFSDTFKRKYGYPPGALRQGKTE